MSDMTDKQALKTKLRDTMLALEAEELETAVAHYEHYLHEAMTDERDNPDREDIALARGNADLAAAFDHPVHTHHAKIDAIENANFSVTDVVRPGAVVAFNNRHFIVVASTKRFDCDGITYMGISTASPIYKAMEGLQAGDTFTHNGQTFTLQDVM
ncbi:hypothetical protein SuNHUV7_24150 (plasmid) [Pseudoseohaeicola sp. NH-UV-7]|uniref:hypothetical protein n=1 Tax=unclassified Sulfitobacter TaxID=196795 RepID=UPI0020C774BA|nr:hypothetical protein [Sulfitobacter sp. JL08]